MLTHGGKWRIPAVIHEMCLGGGSDRRTYMSIYSSADIDVNEQPIY